MYDEVQKQRIYEWRKKNKEKYKEIQNKATKKYQEENWEKHLIAAAKYREKHRAEINQKQKEKNKKIIENQ